MSDARFWVWMPHAAHYILSHRGSFHLATCVGDYIVSTVGEIRNEMEGRKFKDIGYPEGFKYESMVFPAVKRDKENEQCCPYEIDAKLELDYERYRTPVEAYNGHMKLCYKWCSKAKGVDDAISISSS